MGRDGRSFNHRLCSLRLNLVNRIHLENKTATVCVVYKSGKSLGLFLENTAVSAHYNPSTQCEELALPLWLYWALCRIPDSRLISFLQMPHRICLTSVVNPVFPPAEIWILGMFTQNSGAVSSKPRLNFKYNQSCLSGLKPSHFLPSDQKRFIITPSPRATTQPTKSPIKWLA